VGKGGTRTGGWEVECVGWEEEEIGGGGGPMNVIQYAGSRREAVADSRS